MEHKTKTRQRRKHNHMIALIKTVKETVMDKIMELVMETSNNTCTDNKMVTQVQIIMAIVI
ncbi:MAG: hypothetical protein LUQ24_02280 [Methanobacterium sp.]|nr:hypothetical protein [Methanobacterium sp.]